jgi:hypothetical protein
MAGQERAGERGTGWASVCVLRERLELAAQEKRVAQGRGCASDRLGGQASLCWVGGQGWLHEREEGSVGERLRKGEVA